MLHSQSRELIYLGYRSGFVSHNFCNSLVDVLKPWWAAPIIKNLSSRIYWMHGHCRMWWMEFQSNKRGGWPLYEADLFAWYWWLSGFNCTFQVEEMEKEFYPYGPALQLAVYCRILKHIWHVWDSSHCASLPGILVSFFYFLFTFSVKRNLPVRFLVENAVSLDHCRLVTGPKSWLDDKCWSETFFSSLGGPLGHSHVIILSTL